MGDVTIRIRSYDLHCINCGETLQYSKWTWLGEVIAGSPRTVRTRANEWSLPIEDELEIHAGLCNRCYDHRSDLDIERIQDLTVDSKTADMFESRGFEASNELRQEIRNEILVWSPRIVFMPMLLVGLNRTFYAERFFSQEGLTSWLEDNE